MNAGQVMREALIHLADGHVFEDVADDDVRAPWIVYQVAGGEIATDLSGTLFDRCRVRVQVAVWHTTPEERTSLMREVLRALIVPKVGAVPLGVPTNSFERETRLHGGRLDVSIWTAV